MSLVCCVFRVPFLLRITQYEIRNTFHASIIFLPLKRFSPNKNCFFVKCLIITGKRLIIGSLETGLFWSDFKSQMNERIHYV